MNNDEKQSVTYDYIVVGTGPAGSVVTKKLSDDRRHSVLALEAGGNFSDNPLIRDSKFAVPIVLFQDFAPQFYMPGHGTPQKGANGRTFPWTGGRLLGGGSSVNNEQYVRPSTAVMDEWESLLGPIWSPEAMVRRFQEIEIYNGNTTAPETRGYNGQLHIRQTQTPPTTMTKKVTEAIARATGFREITDYNDPHTPLGPFTSYQLYQRPDGIRDSADTAFLNRSVMTRTGEGVAGRRLRVSFRSTVTRVLFNGNKAIGVEYIQDGSSKYAYARKKVILSAGITSVPILMHSGIGPAHVLKKYGIPIVFPNKNVGKHYADHPSVAAVFSTNPADRAFPPHDPNSLYQGGAFLPDPSPGANKRRRGIQLFAQAGANNELAIGAILLQPKSRGRAIIQDTDPLKVILGDQGYLADDADLATFISVYTVYIKQIAEQLRAIDAHYKLITPSLELINDEAKLTQFIKDNLAPGFHPQSMNRMGTSPTNSVVNAKGAVHGVHNLIVADDTIIPFTVDGNTSAPAFLIGKTIAEQLLKNRSD